MSRIIRNHHYTALWSLVIILLLATFLRINDLDQRSLWADEGWTLVLAQGPTIPEIVQRMAYDQHPPLYFVAIHLWRDLTGSSELALRMLSVLTGIIAIAGIYQLGRMMFSRTAGILAAFFLALSDHHIDLAQDVRHYAQLATLIILSTWFYFRLVRSDVPSRGTRVGYVLISAGLLYSHYLGGFVLICQAVHMLLFVRPWRQLRWALFHFGAICLSFLPWLPVVIRQNQVRWETPLYYLNALPNSFETYIMVRDAVLGKQFAITLVLIGLGLVWLYYGPRRVQVKLKPLGPAFFAALWVSAYIALTWYVNGIPDRQFLTIRNFIVITPGIALLVGHGLANLQAGLRWFMALVLLLVGLSTVDTRQLKPPWREVVQTVTRYHNPDEPVLMDIWVGDFPGRYYIEQQMGDAAPWISLREARDEYETQFLPFVLSQIQEEDAFWVIYWRSEPITERQYAGIFAQAGFELSASLTTDHAGNLIYTHRYDRRPADSVAAFGGDERVTFSLENYAIYGDVKAGETLRVQLLWTADQRPALDYSFSVFLLDSSGLLVNNHDGPPLNGQRPTSSWAANELVFDEHRLALPADLAPGVYTLGVKIYHYLAPSEPLPVICDPDQAAEACEWPILEQFPLD